jgi:hypothetical protein
MAFYLPSFTVPALFWQISEHAWSGVLVNGGYPQALVLRRWVPALIRLGLAFRAEIDCSMKFEFSKFSVTIEWP